MAVLVFASRQADAEPDPNDASVARGLFFEARDLMSQQRWEEACPKLEESERLDPGKGTEFNLADCYEHLGRLATAWGLFERVVGEAHDEGKPEHEELARKRAEALAPRVPILVVEVPEESRPAGLEVTRDGQVLAQARWSQPMRVDPGRHVIAARAPERLDWETTLELVAGATITVRLPVLTARSLDPNPAPPMEPPPAAATASVPDGATPRARGNPLRTVAVTMAGLGAAGLVAGGVFAGLSLAARDDSRSWCNDANACTSQLGVDDRTAAIRNGNVATAFMVGGAVFVAAGVVLWLTTRPGRAN
jgi:hypothetical protein